MTDDLLLPSKVVMFQNTVHEYHWYPYARAKYYREAWKWKKANENDMRWLMTDCYRAWIAGGHDLMERFRLNAIVGMES